MNTLAVNTGIDRNVAIFNERVAAYDKKPGARVGDYLILPYGLCTRFTHKWDDHIQTGGNSSSFYLGNGYISYSGGLDSGVKLSDIELTDEVKSGMIWFFDKDISGAGRGVNFEMNFRVFKLKEGANTNGLPQIARHEKSAMIAQADTITRINGNGQPYTLALPEVIIQCDTLNDVVLGLLQKNTGMTFTKSFGGYAAQPMKHEQLNTLLLTYNFTCKYYNNATWSNTMFLTFAKD